MRTDLPLLNRTFVAAEHFERRAGATYALLPLRFLRLDEDRYIVTNFAGEYIVVPRQTLHALAMHELEIHSDAYNLLKARHFLLDGDSTVALDLLACQYRTRQSLLAHLTNLFLFVVTLRCEHSCPYCQVSRQSEDRRAYDMTESQAAKAIDFVFESPSADIKIEFQGGEPLLNFDLVRWIVENITRRNRKAERSVEFVIATNLALLTDEILDLCCEYDVALSTSLDGPRELHNTNRPRMGGDSYERTIRGIERARERLGVDRVSALMTTTKASLSRPKEIVDEYVEQGFTSIFLRSISPFGFAVKTGAVTGYTVDAWLAFYKEALDYIIHLNQRGVSLREEYASMLLRKMLTPFPSGYVDLQSPAGLGISCLAFNYDGDIYASDEARMLAEMGDDTFRLGNVTTDRFEEVISSDKLINILSDTLTESMPMCADCGVQPFCGSDPVFHYATQNDPVGSKPASGFCNKNMEIIRHLVRLLEDDGRAAAVLRSWIF